MTTLFESPEIKVYMNNSGEVFHYNNYTKVTIRIDSGIRGTLITADRHSQAGMIFSYYNGVINNETMIIIN